MAAQDVINGNFHARSDGPAVVASRSGDGLNALLEETDAALAECLERLHRVPVSEVPLEFRHELIFLQDLLRAARVDLTVHYDRS